MWNTWNIWNMLNMHVERVERVEHMEHAEHVEHMEHVERAEHMEHRTAMPRPSVRKIHCSCRSVVQDTNAQLVQGLRPSRSTLGNQ